MATYTKPASFAQSFSRMMSKVSSSVHSFVGHLPGGGDRAVRQGLVDDSMWDTPDLEARVRCVYGEVVSQLCEQQQ